MVDKVSQKNAKTISRRHFIAVAAASSAVLGVENENDTEGKTSHDFDSEQSATLNVALLQMTACDNNQQQNLKKGEEFCRDAARQGAHIALFPEMWNVGYTQIKTKDPDTLEKWKAQAITSDSAFVNHFRKLAKELDIAIALTYLQKSKGQPKNSVSLIDRTGKIIMTYSKVHTCDFTISEVCTDPGDDFYVTTLSTVAGNVNVGFMICYDREQPESARILMLKGAELILTPNACRLSDISVDEFKIRGYENCCAVAMANYAQTRADEKGKRRHPENGRSCAYDAKGENVVLAGKQQGIYIAKFNLDEIRQRQKTFTLANAWRRPAKYSLLLSNHVADVHERKNALGKPFDRTKR
jgi:predicted amidohydrolase